MLSSILWVLVAFVGWLGMLSVLGVLSPFLIVLSFSGSLGNSVFHSLDTLSSPFVWWYWPSMSLLLRRDCVTITAL